MSTVIKDGSIQISLNSGKVLKKIRKGDNIKIITTKGVSFTKVKNFANGDFFFTDENNAQITLSLIDITYYISKFEKIGERTDNGERGGVSERSNEKEVKTQTFMQVVCNGFLNLFALLVLKN